MGTYACDLSIAKSCIGFSVPYGSLLLVTLGVPARPLAVGSTESD
jgi:hypothetical protein